MRLYTNPGSNLTPELVERYGVAILPQRIAVDGTYYDTREPIPHDEVDRWVATAKRWPTTIGTTSAETIDGFFDGAAAGAQEHIVVTTSRHVINSHQSAEVAASTFTSSPRGKDHRIAIVDSGVTDVGTALLCVLAGEAIKAGCSFDDVEKLLTAAATDLRTVFSVTTLDNMVKGGRATFLRAFVADVLGVRPIIAFQDGVLGTVGKYRQREDMAEQLATWLKTQVAPGRTVWLGLAHTQSPSILDRLPALLKDTWDIAGVYRRPLAPGVYLYGGPGCQLASVLPIDGLPFTPPAVAALHP